jgi:Cys-rich repeat protein
MKTAIGLALMGLFGASCFGDVNDSVASRLKSTESYFSVGRNMNTCDNNNDDECPAGEVCVDGYCVYDEGCISDSQCGAGGQCIDGTCI